MSNINCEVIEDILPIYVENMASPSTRTLVDEHLASCASCKQKEEQMQQNIPLPKDISTKSLSNICKLLFRKRVTAVAMTILSMLLLALLCLIHLNSPIEIPYEDIADSIKVDIAEDNSVSITIAESLGGSFSSEYETDDVGNPVQYITLYTTRLKQLQKITTESCCFNILNTGDNIDEKDKIRRIYYTPSKQNGEAICIYEDDAIAGNFSGGVIVLPRLTLNYYTIFAVLLSIVGILICIAYRKQEDKLFLALKLTLLPITYFICSLIILWNKEVIYNVSYYFSGILLATFVLYIMGYWMITFVRYRKMYY